MSSKIVDGPNLLDAYLLLIAFLDLKKSKYTVYAKMQDRSKGKSRCPILIFFVILFLCAETGECEDFAPKRTKHSDRPCNDDFSNMLQFNSS